MRMDQKRPRSIKEELVIFIALLGVPIIVFASISAITFMQGERSISGASALLGWLVGTVPGAIIGFRYYAIAFSKITFVVLYPILCAGLFYVEFLWSACAIGGSCL